MTLLHESGSSFVVHGGVVGLTLGFLLFIIILSPGCVYNVSLPLSLSLAWPEGEPAVIDLCGLSRMITTLGGAAAQSGVCYTWSLTRIIPT